MPPPLDLIGLRDLQKGLSEIVYLKHVYGIIHIFFPFREKRLLGLFLIYSAYFSIKEEVVFLCKGYGNRKIALLKEAAKKFFFYFKAGH